MVKIRSYFLDNGNTTSITKMNIPEYKTANPRHKKI